MTQSQPFNVEDASVADIQAALDGGTLSVRRLVELYLARIEAFDRNGPKINAVIALNPAALDEADHLDVQLRAGGGTTKPLRGVVLLIKDQIDVRGMPTTLGSVLFKDFRPERDGFVVGKLKAAGAVVIGKATLGELGGGDTHGSLFGSTRNVYDLARTAGGSSGGSGAGCPPASALWRSGRKVFRPFDGQPFGTASSACARRRGS